MQQQRNIGIYMDHSAAQLIEITNYIIATKTITSKFTHEAKELTLLNSEKGMHQKEQHQQSSYYKALGEVIKKYTRVLLFGPTTAKSELYNLLVNDYQFNKINIAVIHADRLTENKQHAFALEYFSKNNI